MGGRRCSVVKELNSVYMEGEESQQWKCSAQYTGRVKRFSVPVVEVLNSVHMETGEVKSLRSGSVNSVFMECETSLSSERAQRYSLGARPVSMAGVLNSVRIPRGARPVSVVRVLNLVCTVPVYLQGQAILIGGCAQLRHLPVYLECETSLSGGCAQLGTYRFTWKARPVSMVEVRNLVPLPGRRDQPQRQVCSTQSGSLPLCYQGSQFLAHHRSPAFVFNIRKIESS
jgi:hypothetical protein